MEPLKYILMLTLVLLPLSGFSFESGEYLCVEGNNDTICRQKVKVYQDSTITALRITYIGYCLGMGSNMFYCKNRVCTSGGQSININGSEYSWEHSAHDIVCHRFVKDSF